MPEKNRIDAGMITTLLMFTLLAFYACTSPSEKGRLEEPRQKAKTDPNADMVAAGYELHESDTIFIDSHEFVIAAYKVVNEEAIVESSLDQIIRPLVVMFKADDGGYALMARNDSIILCGSCGGINGDPFESIESEQDGFTVYHSGGSSDRWTRNITFQFDQIQKAWLLTADQGANFSTLDPENSFNEVIYTPADSLGKTILKQFNTYNSF